jgi:acetyltransferase-like isoleucine patch superfamily enzyme
MTAQDTSPVTTARKATPGTALSLVRALLTLRRHGVRHGRLPSFTGRAPRITNDGTISVGERFAVRAHQVRAALSTGPGGRLDIGDRVFVNQGAVLHAAQWIRIGARVRIGDNTAICDTDFHEVEPGLGVKVAPIVIGDDVWLARGVTVLPGSRIGEGSVIGAGSVVRGEIPAWVVAVGNPARPVREITTRGERS